MRSGQFETARHLQGQAAAKSSRSSHSFARLHLLRMHRRMILLLLSFVAWSPKAHIAAVFFPGLKKFSSRSSFETLAKSDFGNLSYPPRLLTDCRVLLQRAGLPRVIRRQAGLLCARCRLGWARLVVQITADAIPIADARGITVLVRLVLNVARFEAAVVGHAGSN